MRKIYSQNDDIFKVEDEKSFYLAGFIAADGCVINVGNEYALRIDLANNDRDFLSNIKDLFSCNKPIYITNRNSSVLTINSYSIFNDLKKFNIVPRKTKIYTFPEWLINHQSVHHFMRGYNDGDGCFYVKNATGIHPKISFELAGTSSFLTTYRSILESKCKLNPRKQEILPINNKNISRLCYSGNTVPGIVSYLYKDATVFLPRKKEIAFKSFQLSGGTHE